MDRLLLSQIDEELASVEVAELCFLCSDVLNRKRLEGIKDAKELFVRLEEKGLLENSSFLSQLLHSIHRADLLNMLENDGGQVQETDASPFLSDYRLMLYRIHEDLSTENLDKMKFLLKDKLAKRHLDMNSTALDVFAEMEKAGLISNKNVNELHLLLLEFDRELAKIVEDYMKSLRLSPTGHLREQRQAPRASSDQQRPRDYRQSVQPSLSMCETEPCLRAETTYSDNTRQAALSDEEEYYILNSRPRGLCVIFNNENFKGPKLSRRVGSHADNEALTSLFKRFGFEVNTHNDLTAMEMTGTLQTLIRRDYSREDALVVCILTHGEKGIVYGTDAKEMKLEAIMQPFNNRDMPTLKGKPKLFFVQACQEERSQEPVCPGQSPEDDAESGTSEQFSEDACRHEDPEDEVATVEDVLGSDVLLGMATVTNHKSYRHTVKGSLYIQELCKQLQKAAESPDNDDILTVLTRVNREVSNNHLPPKRQMPEPKYTLTKRLVLRFI
uniref:Caspase-8 n=1 Tax=Fundulus heteroclitus TaxID=8078 RepID=A0A3Q2PV92_FUNHE